MSLDDMSDPIENEAQDEQRPRTTDRDARLAAARAKREKILAEQAASPKKTNKPKAPVLLNNVDVEAETAAFLFDTDTTSSASAPAEPAEIVVASTPALRPAPVALSTESPAVETLVEKVAKQAPLTVVVDRSDTALTQGHVPRPSSPVALKSRMNRLGFVVVAGFGGLGFGFALGLGAMFGLGWISPDHIASSAPVATSSKPVISAAAPVAMTAAPAAPVVASVEPATALVLPVVHADTTTPADSGLAQIAWMDGLTIAPHAQLPTQTAQSAGLDLARLGVSESSNPADVLGGYLPTLAMAPTQINLPAPTELSNSATATPVSAVQTAWAADLTIAPHAQLSTQTENDANLGLARFQALETNNPAQALAGYAPLQITATAGTTASPEVIPVTTPANAAAYQMSALPRAETAFLAPVPDLSTLSVQTASLSSSTVNSDVPAAVWPTLDGQVASFAPELPKELNFAQALGLSDQQVQAFNLVLLAPDSVKDADIDAFGTQLGQTGLPLTNQKKVGFTISKPHIRYYSADSKTVAMALADRLGVEPRDFTSAGRKTTQIEVWMSGRSATPVTKPRKAPLRRTKTPSISTRTKLSNSIISGLRNANTN